MLIAPGGRVHKNLILVEENPVTDVSDVASRIAQRALAKRGASYADEVRRLLDAALGLMRRQGTSARPRVSDIVAAAGLSNDAFYRHFPSKDALVAALLEDGTDRLRSYVAHQMTKADDPAERVRAWVRAILSQADADIAATTRAVLWNAGVLTADLRSPSPSASARLAGLLEAPFAALGSDSPEFDATLAAYLTFGKLGDHVARQAEPTREDIDRVTAFCLRAVTR